MKTKGTFAFTLGPVKGDITVIEYRQPNYKAVTSREAAEFIREHGEQIDLVVSDVVMPKLGGMQLYEETRDSSGRPPFLFTSGYAPGEVLDRVDGEGQPVFLRKPWTVSDLVLRVREALDRAS